MDPSTIDPSLWTGIIDKYGILGMSALALAYGLVSLYRAHKMERDEWRQAQAEENRQWRLSIEKQWEIHNSHAHETNQILRELSSVIGELRARQ